MKLSYPFVVIFNNGMCKNVITYDIAAINSNFLISLSFFLSLVVNKTIKEARHVTEKLLCPEEVRKKLQLYLWLLQSIDTEDSLRTV